MITAIRDIAKIEGVLNRFQTIEFNATLPVSLKVLEKLEQNRYLLLIGNKTTQTKSLIPLEENREYWGDFKYSKENILQLSNLLKKPDFEQKKLSKEIFFKFEELEKIFSKESPKKSFKENILQKLSVSENRQDFIQLSNMLLALREDIFFIPIEYEQRRYFFQFKKKQKNDIVKKEFTISFYASFKNLGPIKGEIKKVKDFTKLTIYTYYEKSMRFLKKEIKELDFDCEIKLSKDISPLFQSGEKLLDIKG